jgi:CDP-diacylglycerol---serine O-phosphatidyltransferase
MKLGLSRGGTILMSTHWMERFEARLGAVLPLHPNLVSLTKILVILPLILLRMMQDSPARTGLALALFLVFGLLDYLDGALARARAQTTFFGRVLDHLTDYPLLLVIAYQCRFALPISLLIGKLLLDFVMVVLNVLGKEKSESWLRTGLNYTTLLALLMLSLGLSPGAFPSVWVAELLVVNIAYTAIVALYCLNVLQKRFIADALSGANLLCGVFSMHSAARGHFSVSLMFLLLGAAFDGFDGAAARKWGGTRWGVYSDDVADAVNYAIAPGVALYFALGGISGTVLGTAYSIFTVSRLVYFTLNKSYGDPDFFCGVPSTVGGIIALCSIILFLRAPAILGLMVGAACMLMVSFDTHYRHLGRAIANNRRIIYGMPPAIVLLLLANALWQQAGPAAIILVASVFYGLLPTLVHLKNLARRS